MKIRIKKKQNSLQDLLGYDSDLPLPFDDDIEEKQNNGQNSTDMAILNHLISMTETKKKKKSKKKKEISKSGKKSKNKKNKNIKIDTSEFYDPDAIDAMTEKKKKEKPNRESEEFYENRFQGSLILLKGLMEEVNNQSSECKEHIAVLKKNPTARGATMAITNQSNTVASLLNTKLSVIKEITSVNKLISELELKNESQKAKQKAEKEKGKDSNSYINEMFEKVMNCDIPIPDIDDDLLLSSNSGKKKKVKGLDIESLDSRIDEMIDSGELEFTDSELAFKYEANGGVEVCILYKIKSKRNKWEFVAYDSNGDEILDYPLPKKNVVGKVDFDLENDIASDQLGNTYRVLYDDEEYNQGGDFDSLDDDDENSEWE